MKDALTDKASHYEQLFDKRIETSTRRQIYSELAGVVENVIHKMQEIEPKSGVLGAEEGSTMGIILSNNNVFPRNFFNSLERETLRVNDRSSINVIGQRDGHILLAKFFIYNGLILQVCSIFLKIVF